MENGTKTEMVTVVRVGADQQDPMFKDRLLRADSSAEPRRVLHPHDSLRLDFFRILIG